MITRFIMLNKQAYVITSKDIMGALSEIHNRATKECRTHLKAAYKEALACPTMTNLIIEDTESNDGEPLERRCSKYYLANFKEASKELADKHPFNFTANLLLWRRKGDVVIAGSTSWGSAKFLDFLDSLSFLEKTNTVPASVPPLLKMEILSPDNYHQVDPAW
jgi:hypothetical protein